MNGVAQLENGDNFSSKFLGYEFHHHGKSIGAVETINNGKVWLKNDLQVDCQEWAGSPEPGSSISHNADKHKIFLFHDAYY